jgi:hypothetical protein
MTLLAPRAGDTDTLGLCFALDPTDALFDASRRVDPDIDALTLEEK